MPLWMKAEVRIIEGKHISFKTINKQLKDKERVSAAIENPALFKVINRGTCPARPHLCPASTVCGGWWVEELHLREASS